MNTEIFDFDTGQPLQFHWCGKFEAPDSNWIHMSRELLDFELIIMTRGELYIAADQEHYIVREGEYILIAPPCRQYGYRPSDCSFYWVHFSYHNMKNDPIRHKKTPAALQTDETRILLPIQANVPRPDRIVILTKQLQNCDIKYRNENLNNYTLTTLLCELYSQLYLSGSQTNLTGEKQKLYSDIVDYVSWRIREPLKVGEIAAYFGYNEKYISTFFKQASGVPLKKYITDRKIELAKAMLTDSLQPIAQIGYDIGFSDNHNFSNAFKKATGQSPSEYRNTYAEHKLFHQ